MITHYQEICNSASKFQRSSTAKFYLKYYNKLFNFGLKVVFCAFEDIMGL